jgi:hypothetical protein
MANEKPSREELIKLVEAKRAAQEAQAPLREGAPMQGKPSREELIKLVEQKRRAAAAPKPTKPGFFDGAVKSTVDALPMIGGVVGGILGTPADVIVGPLGNAAGAGIGGYLGTAAKNLINSKFYPEDAPKTMTEVLTQPVVGGIEQGLAQGAGDAAAPLIVKGTQAAAKPVASALRKFAAKKAVTATGATGVQAMKFSDKAGGELLDQGIVSFGNSQGKVAEKATKALEKSGEEIGKVITHLDSKGVKVDHANVVKAIRE